MVSFKRLVLKACETLNSLLTHISLTFMLIQDKLHCLKEPVFSLYVVKQYNYHTDYKCLWRTHYSVHYFQKLCRLQIVNHRICCCLQSLSVLVKFIGLHICVICRTHVQLFLLIYLTALYLFPLTLNFWPLKQR